MRRDLLTLMMRVAEIKLLRFRTRPPRIFESQDEWTAIFEEQDLEEDETGELERVMESSGTRLALPLNPEDLLKPLNTGIVPLDMYEEVVYAGKNSLDSKYASLNAKDKVKAMQDETSSTED